MVARIAGMDAISNKESVTGVEEGWCCRTNECDDTRVDDNEFRNSYIIHKRQNEIAMS